MRIFNFLREVEWFAVASTIFIFLLLLLGVVICLLGNPAGVYILAGGMASGAISYAILALKA